MSERPEYGDPWDVRPKGSLEHLDRGISRRDFVSVTALSAGAMLVTVALPHTVRAGMPRSLPPDTATVNAYIRIDPDGAITITTPKIEMGQGTSTSLPMIVADEMDADWSRVVVELATLDQSVYGWQGAGGSTSIWTSWMPLRRAGASARMMFLGAAAEGWGVAPGTCRTETGRVIHEASGRSADYGDLTEAATRMPVPPNPRLKTREEFALIGRPTPHIGVTDAVSGRIRYGLDTAAPGMLYASIERGPFGARPLNIDDAATRSVAGVHDVVPLPSANHRSILANGVAVVAESTWAALKGRRALDIEWSRSPEPDTDTLRDTMLAAVRRPGPVLRDDGDFDGAIQAAANIVEAEYELPFLAHAPMEPGNCFADVRDGRVELRGPFQDPGQAQQYAAEIAGVPPNQVTVQPARLGGGFGRRLSADYAAEAVSLAMRLNSPVKTVWTREDDIRFDLYRPTAAHQLQAGFDDAGNVVAWRHRQASTSRYAFQDPSRPAEASEFYVDDPPARMIPNYRLEYTPVESLVPRGALRSVIHSGNGFVVESFVDELAHAAGRDPLEFRLSLIGEDRELPYSDHGGPVLETDRLRGVLEAVGDAAGWGGRSTLARGVAGHFTFGSYAAQVAEVSVDSDGRVRVHRVIAAIDCGIPVNPLGIEGQVIGGVVFGLTAALYGEITVSGGMVEQGNFHDYPPLRSSEMPEIEVVIVDSGRPPRGAGETSVPPIAPAVANAIFAATGVRIRRPPFTAATAFAGGFG